MGAVVGARDLAPAPRPVQVLLANACKHTVRGAIAVSVDDEAAGDGGARRWRFRVSDSGPGIPQARRSLIFEKWGGGPVGSVSDGMGGTSTSKHRVGER